MKQRQLRSPLKARPWRNPGQSLDEEIQRIFDEEIVTLVSIAWISVVFAALEWVRWWRDAPYQPVMYTIAALGAVVFVAFRFMRARKRMRALQQGRDGEKAVGQYLDLLREDGHRIFHDVVAGGFNIDHVIISRQGIFAVETKTFGKPAGRKAVIRLDGDRVLVDGHEPDRDAVKQVLALADWLRDTLEESTGKRFAVRGVVLYPGWWVEGRPQNGRVWVLNPKALPGFLDNERETLSEANVSLATYHLSRYIRAA